MTPSSNIPKKTLGPLSAFLIDELSTQNLSIFTLDQAVEIIKKNRKQTTRLLGDLVKREVIARLRGGLYLILHMGQESNQLNNWGIIASRLAEPGRFYISHYSAMRIAGMTAHALNEVFITTSRRHRSIKLSFMTYRFIFSKIKNIWGVRTHWINKQEKIFVSDIERTLLDGFDRLDLCGGVATLISGIWTIQKEINWERLLDYAKKFPNKAAVKRLGYTLELLNLGETILSNLQNIIIDKKNYVLLDPNENKAGKYIKKWYVRINLNSDELKASVWG